jgi:hypothetical protein
MEHSVKAKAVGSFIIASNRLDAVRGGKQKLQKIVGKSIFYQSEDGKKWFFNTKKINAMSISKLNELTEKVKNA